MLLIYGLALLLSIIGLFSSYIRLPSGGITSGGSKDQIKPTRISRWASLKTVISMLFSSREIPNYEIFDIKPQQLRRKILIFNLQHVKEALIVVVDLGAAKQVMNSGHWVSRFRDNHYLFKCTYNKPYGILFGGGEHWKEGRSLTLRLLHHLKFYKQENLDQITTRELENIISKFESKFDCVKQGAAATFSPHNMFQVHALNLVSQVGWSERFTDNDYFVTNVIQATNKMNSTFNVGFGVLEVLPWLTCLPDLTFYGDFKRASAVTADYFKNILKQRRSSGMYKTSPIDFTDHFLLEIENRQNTSIINDEAYCIIMRDLFWAGMETTNTVLQHGLLQMALRPDLQNRVQSEIRDAIGQRRANYADRRGMPFTQATLLEILRYSSPVPLTSRCALENDAQISSDQVPKGSLCVINIYAINRSPEIWSDPFEFRPERFLSSEGKIINADKIIPFGYGKRVCIGESVARTFLFVVFVTLLQRYTFEISDKHPPPEQKNLPGISRSPVPYFLSVRRRQSTE